MITVDTHEKALVIHVCCRRFDYGTIDKLQNDIAQQARMKPRLPVILELSQVEVASSVTMGVLIDMLKNLREQGRQMILTGLNPYVRSSISVTRLDQMFKIEASVEEALARCSSRREDRGGRRAAS